MIFVVHYFSSPYSPVSVPFTPYIVGGVPSSSIDKRANSIVRYKRILYSIATLSRNLSLHCWVLFFATCIVPHLIFRLFYLQVQLIKYVKTSIYGYGACTGTIISDRHILSAAHCFANVPDLDRVEIFMGSTVNVLSATGPVNFIRRTVYKKDIIVHKDYNASDYVCSEIHLNLN